MIENTNKVYNLLERLTENMREERERKRGRENDRQKLEIVNISNEDENITTDSKDIFKAFYELLYSTNLQI